MKSTETDLKSVKKNCQHLKKEVDDDKKIIKKQQDKVLIPVNKTSNPFSELG